MNKPLTALQVLRQSSFGQRTAEEEVENLSQYFVETEHWRRVFDGLVDIVYGPKGSGKSAIYSLIVKNESVLFDRNILAIPGENPQGAVAFQSLRDDPPRDDFEFVSLWKIYILTLCGRAFKEYSLQNEKSKIVVDALEEANLLPSSFTLAKALRYALDYVKTLARRVEAVEGGLTVDPATFAPGVSGKISLREPSAAAAKLGAISIDELLDTANSALKEFGLTIWILLDRLDVAFSNMPELEASALRALFKYYLDTKQLTAIRPKIFLRTDIWRGIVKDGFREASHLERSLTITWRNEDILNLVVRRLVSNNSITDYYSVSREEILADAEKQAALFYQVAPRQVDSGPNKPDTLKWLITRTSDASKAAAPRELIHMLNELRSEQVKKLERGDRIPPERQLFEQTSFKDALPIVSQTRLEQTLYAEYARLKPFIEKLREKRATQSLTSVAELWGLDEAEALVIVGDLEAAGFLEKFGKMWRVPFLYRPALNLVQGAVGTEEVEE
ncbi:P-loop ATPase, Sll1717 family [Rhizobium ruizarguesonis]|uniref:P-loop ATPase, Sll1717 family n=1 Tax=Rhizobium ruizarguesonis TaxID=2081791 RepID=UPI00103195AE|nr:hypothetical protein [Rhizobium ruizarguesonis]TAW18877.1 hypothetical protein ELI25_25290 [Rhizobium ruizarguesonis]TAZ54554.1 hypothetical protein ELH76_27140 [Rhizobium ruizarguesonis]